jgi:hypothetical protein
MGSQTSTGPRQAYVLGIAVAAVAAALIAPTAAGAATPCWQRVYDEWGTGAVRQTHSQACYRAALSHLPFDMRAYTTAQRDIMTAMLAASRIREGGTPNSSEAPRLSRGGSGVASAQATRSLQNRTPTPRRVAVPATPVANTGVSVPLHFWLALAFAVALVMAAGVRTVQGRLATRRALRDRFHNGED